MASPAYVIKDRRIRVGQLEHNGGRFVFPMYDARLKRIFIERPHGVTFKYWDLQVCECVWTMGDEWLLLFDNRIHNAGRLVEIPADILLRDFSQVSLRVDWDGPNMALPIWLEHDFFSFGRA